MPEKRRMLVNSISMLVNRLAQAITTFVLTASISRTLGVYKLGQYLLGMSYFYIFVHLASQGLKTLLTREIAREPESTSIYLASGTILQFALCILGYTALLVVVFLLPYSADTSLVCYIVGLAIIPFGLSNITEAILQAREKIHLIAISTAPIYILRLLAMIWAINLNYGIEYIAGIFVFSETLILICEWLLIIKVLKPKFQIKKNFIWNIIKASRTFFAIEGIGIVASRIDMLILSLLGNESLIGIYGAVGQLLQPFSLISSSVSLAVFPNMSKAVFLGKEKQREVIEGVIEILLCMGLPFLVGILFIGQELLLFIYKDPSFSQEKSGLILNILLIGLITSIFTRTFSYLLIANGFEKFNLIEVTATTLVGGISGIVLISQYKLLGAALMGLAMTFTNFGILTYFVYTRIFQLRLWKVMVLPLVISGFMSFSFLIMQKLHINLLSTIILATCAYGFFVGALAIKQLGGLNAVRQKFFIKKQS